MRGSGDGGGVATATTLGLVVLGLLPFLDKALHIDDPLFVWNAQQIVAAPLDCFGSQVNWRGQETSMAVATQNPPLASYYMALVIAIAGSRELILHLAFLVFPIAAVLGTMRLARGLGVNPVVAALSAALTPGFLVASTSVMSDMMMLALYVWAIALWVEGVQDGTTRKLVLAGLLAGLGVVTKYYALSLIPLLAAYTWKSRSAGEPAPRSWATALSIPLVSLLVWEAWTASLYGAGHFQSAMGYAGQARAYLGASIARSGLVGLTFAGGCTASVLFLAPWLWSRRALLAGLGASGLVAAAVALGPELGTSDRGAAAGLSWALSAQVGIFAVAGASVIALALADWMRRRDASASLLALWVVGTFVFAAFLNWSNNARSILPLAPAVGILVARRLGDTWGGATLPRTPIAASLLASLALAFAVTWADYALAGSAREAAQRIGTRFADVSEKVWFQGHWGFQYYLERYGASAIDVAGSLLATGDVVVIPSNNANLLPMPRGQLRPLGTLELDAGSWLASMNPAVGAGFYSSAWGPLPFAFERVPLERYRLLAVERPIRFPISKELPF